MQATVPRQHGARARARHHDQGADRAPDVQGRRRPDLSAQPDRHARARRLHATRSRARSPPAKARCSSSTRRRASRRRRSPTSTWRSRTTSRSSRCSTRSTCRAPTPSARGSEVEEVDRPRLHRTRVLAQRQDRASASTRSSKRSSSASRRPKGDADGAAARADLRQLVRQLPRRGRAGARGRRHAAARATKIRLMATQARTTKSPSSACSRRFPRPSTSSGRGEVGFVVAGIKIGARHQGRRHHHRARKRPATEPLAGFKEVKPMVFAGIYPDRRRRLRRPARRAREAAPQRRGVHVRARHLGRARLRLPLRLPRPAAHGRRAGAARARVQPRPDHHRAERRLPGHDQQGRGAAGREPVASCPTRARSTTSKSRIFKVTIHMPAEYVGAVIKLCEDRRGIADRASSTPRRTA